jgi:hypothetical protein
MSELTILNTAIQSIKSAQEIAKLIRESRTSLKEAEVNLNFSNLLNALSDAQVEIADIKTLIIDKNHEIVELREKLTTKDSLLYKAPYYFLKNGDKEDGPYCQKCYDSENIMIRLQATGSPGYWKCFNCQSCFEDENYSPHSPVTIY